MGSGVADCSAAGDNGVDDKGEVGKERTVGGVGGEEGDLSTSP